MKDQTQLKKALFICFTVIMVANFFLLAVDIFLILQLTLFSPDAITPQSATEISLAEDPLIETETLPATNPTEIIFTATPELAATETRLPTKTIEPTQTPTPLVQDGVYEVKPFESLQQIAESLGVSAENLRQANQMIGDTVFPGQTLSVPPDGNFSRPPYNFSPLFSSDAYSLKIESPQANQFLFELNFIPDQHPQTASEQLYPILQNSVNQVNTLYRINFKTTFNVYLAGTLFEENPNLRSTSRTQPDSELYLLFDGTGNHEDIQSRTTFAFARLYQESLFGEAASPFLKEGSATYSSLSIPPFPDVQIPLRQYCKAYLIADVMPDLSDLALEFNTTNTDLRNFHTAGCFFDFLLTSSDINTITELYQTGDYDTLYEKSLDALLLDFEDWLQDLPLEERTRPLQYVSIETDLTGLYESFMPNFDGSEEHISIYRELDLARIAMLEGRYEDAGNQLLIAKLAIQTNGSNNGGGGGALPEKQPTPTKIDLNITITPPALPTQSP